MQWDELFAKRTSHMKRSTIREILKLTGEHEMISFAGGLPAPEFFPVERVQQATDTVLSERGQEALQYSATEGMPELRDMIAERMSTSNLHITRDNVLITSGSQQGIDLLGRIMMDEGDPVVVENPTYLGALMAWRTFALRYVPVPTDNDGMQVDALEPLLSQNPKLIYTMPTFQNPGGFTLSLPRRQQLVRLLNAHHVPLIEDDAYGALRYSGDPLPTLLELDAMQRGSTAVDGHVIYMGTFSKVLTPGYRVAWVVAPDAVIDKMIAAKQACDLHTNTIGQFVTYEVARDGFLDAHIEVLRNVYRERRDMMLQALADYFPEECSWTQPDGGLFVLVRLPQGVDGETLLRAAVPQGVAFVYGDEFHLDGTGSNTVRLNFSNTQPDRMREGVRRLGQLVKEAMLAVAQEC